MTETKRRWVRNNRDKTRAASSRWNKINKVKYDAYNKEYHRTHPKQRRVYQKNWLKKHPEVRRALRWRYKARKRGAKGNFTGQQWLALCKKFNNKCVCCLKKRKLTHDHVIPLSKGGSNYITNLQPLCKPCNSKKRAKCTDYRKTYAKRTRV